MLLPSIFGDDFFNDWYGFTKDFDKNFFARSQNSIMKTDVVDTTDSYELSMDLPGYNKEDITAEIKDGYLIVSASKSEESEKENEGVYIRRERYIGNVSRAFYVGKSLNETDIKAEFKNGILNIIVPKETPKQIEQNRKLVAIAG